MLIRCLALLSSEHKEGKGVKKRGIAKCISLILQKVDQGLEKLWYTVHGPLFCFLSKIVLCDMPLMQPYFINSCYTQNLFKLHHAC